MSKRRIAIAVALAATALTPVAAPILARPALAQSAAPAPTAAQALSWPRTFAVGDQTLQVYQPLIETWNGDQIGGRAAIALGPKDGTPIYGTARFTASVSIDKPTRLAYLSQLSVSRVDVPTDPTQDATLKTALQSRVPAQGWTVALDHLETSYAAGKGLTAELNVPVKNDPPKIVFRSVATDLVLISGEPVLEPVDGASSFRRIANTRALILVGPDNIYHAQVAGYWYQSPSLDGSWVETTTVDPSVADAAKVASKASAPDAMLPESGKKPDKPPQILVTDAPTELILTTGEPQMAPVTGSTLLRMTNADHAVFLDPDSNLYYVLISGRWFSGRGGPSDPWAFVPGSSLPAGFAKISPQDPGASALVSVPGTPQAKEAAIAATIPQTATVKRSTALDIKYGGAPSFVPIQGTKLLYAANTTTPVIELDSGRYYALSDGIWFVSQSPTGPWMVADIVPDAIYTIPVSSPLHYVTYVQVYSSTPDTVIVGYTPGYFGVNVSDGLVVYGTGYPCTGYVADAVWYGCPVTYGYGANFMLDTAVGFGFGFAAGYAWGAATPYWGPYWGAGPWGGTWNHVNINQTNIYGRWGGEATATHSWGYNAWTGNEWSTRSVSGETAGGTNFAARSGAAFNPYTGNGAAGRQSASYNANTGIAHASEGGITDTNGNINAASRGVATNTKTGNSVAWNNGNVYSDHDGNVHQYSDTNGWQTHSDSGWQDEHDTNTMNDLDNQRQFQSMGQDRVDNFSNAGGFDSFGGDHSSDFGGGERFGGDSFGGGGGFGGGRFGGGGFGGGGFGGGGRR
ncbi:carbohydrate-binding family V/XII [Kaistia algarum]|uniref:carbohydrate-binding family V/XII n=1 Tax=Kaistia algarum TaxID=2083279 RepID=UPI000CE8CD7E|nr:carbohydrate-binding family V/XII [Kaistia algarum]MCX5513877.1 carbohydrate-binding family V/XII [Kaistia algarum]PPE79267.1 carbohydrate-binding family V/XII [Kaistia algarum]